jgi:hypothetical protein
MDGCTADRCDPQRGCEQVPMDDGATCDDGDLCTQTDRCTSGVCTGGEPLVCAAPTPICSGGVCTAGPPESCDGLDNDLDAEVDEDLTTSCYAGPAGTGGRGSCRVGERRCTAGKPSACLGEVLPAGEVCNGADDDCDGQLDEGLRNACGGCLPLAVAPATRCDNGLPGSCARSGTYACSGSDATVCNAEVGSPVSETCNGADDDCDGQIDELVPVDCFEDGAGTTLMGTPGVGACALGKKRCTGGALSACMGAIGALDEVCGNDRDEDCSGDVCTLHAIVLNARKVDDRAHVYRGHEGLSGASAICEGKDLDCDLRADALAQTTSPDALRAVRYTLKLSNADCSATRGEFALLIDGLSHLLPAQALVERVHCGFTHRVAFTVDFLAGTFKVDKEDRCLLDWLCRD